jgi:hypothetical protein
MIHLLTLSFVLTLAAIVFILWPLLELKSVSEKPRHFLRELERLLFERERYLTNLKDLELDHQMNKLSEADYTDLRSQLFSEAGTIFTSLEKLEKENPIIVQIEKDALALEKELP